MIKLNKNIYVILFFLLLLTACEGQKKQGMFSNFAKTFEGALENPKGITSLNVSEKGIKTVPAEIDGRFENLLQLILNKNEITQLPKNIGRLPKLKHFFLHDNKLTSLPKSIRYLKKVELFYVYSNELTSLPDVPLYFTENTIIDLNWNKLTALPPAFGGSRCHTLSLTGNPLEKLPNNFGNIRGLKKLNLANTNLTDLPKSFYKLKQLKTLDIRGTKLTKKHFDELWKKLPSCEILSDFNPIKD